MPTFRPKNFNLITASMVNWMAHHQNRITDFNPGAISRTMLEGVALEMEEVYYRLYTSLGPTITEGIFNTFVFPRLTPTRASGNVQFSRTTTAASADIAIPFGTIVATEDDREYQVIVEDAKIAVGGVESGDVAVQALVIGTVSNVGAGTIASFTTPIVGVDAVRNDNAISGGLDFESDASRQARFNLFIQSLARGTLPALEYAALNIPEITTARAIDNQPVFVLRYPRLGGEPDPRSSTSSPNDFSSEANAPYEYTFPLMDTTGTGRSAAVFAAAIQFSSIYFDLTQNGEQGLGATGASGEWKYWTTSGGWTHLPLENYQIDEFKDFSGVGTGPFYIYLEASEGDVSMNIVNGSTINVTGAGANTGFFTVGSSDFEVGSPSRTRIVVVELVTDAGPGTGGQIDTGDGTVGLTKSGSLRFDLDAIGGNWSNIVFGAGSTDGAQGNLLFPILFEEAVPGSNQFTQSPEAVQVFTDPAPGMVNLYVSEGGGILSELSSGAKEKVEERVEVYRSGGIRVRVYGPITRSVGIEVGIRVSPQFDANTVISLVQTALANYTTGFVLGQSIYTADLIQFLMNLEDDAILDVEIQTLGGHTPATDIIASPNQLLSMPLSTVVVNQI